MRIFCPGQIGILKLSFSLEGGKLPVNYSEKNHWRENNNNPAINIFNVWQKAELNLGCTDSKPVLSVPCHPYYSTQIHVDTFLSSKLIQMMSFNQ